MTNLCQQGQPKKHMPRSSYPPKRELSLLSQALPEDLMTMRTSPLLTRRNKLQLLIPVLQMKHIFL